MQKYFQKRVQHWLDTVGKNIFNIRHHWCRFEFAPSRGQINAHILVVSDHNELLKDTMSKIGPITNMSKFIAEWVEKSFSMTAMMPDEPEMQANVTVLFEIEKETSNTNKNKEELKNDQKATTRSSAGKSSDKIPIKRKKDFNKNHPLNFLYCYDAV